MLERRAVSPIMFGEKPLCRPAIEGVTGVRRFEHRVAGLGLEARGRVLLEPEKVPRPVCAGGLTFDVQPVVTDEDGIV
jgi:hypothetical protein